MDTFDTFSVAKLVKLLESPLDTNVTWCYHLETPITRAEVRALLDSGESLISPDQVERRGYHQDIYTFNRREGVDYRHYHASRIAWMVKNYEEMWPINIEFGLPGTRCEPYVVDGNHRFAAAIYLKKETIQATWGGSVEVAKSCMSN
jgi:hypothetical protein